MEDLEWVSHFVDDSLPELSLLYPVRSEEANRFVEPEPSVKKTPRFPWEMKITTKARTVRNRKSQHSRVVIGQHIALAPVFAAREEAEEAG